MANAKVLNPSGLCMNPLSLFSYCSNSLGFVIYCNFIESNSVLTPASLLACYVILVCYLLQFPVGQHLLLLYVLWK